MNAPGKFFLFFLLQLSWITAAHAQLETKPTPMWEGIEKSALDIESDEKLVKSALEITNGDRRAAATAMLRVGWNQIADGKINEAIRSFNQAWLIDPEFADIHWGFAIATHVRGDDLPKIENHFDRALDGNENDARLATDRGRVLEQRNMPEKARFWFEKAISIDAGYAPAYFGMVLVAQALEDGALEAEFKKKHDELIGKKQ